MVGYSRIALLATVIPFALIAIAAIVVALLNPNFAETDGFTVVDIPFYVGFGLVVAGFISAIVFANKDKREITRGIIFGNVIGIIVLVIIFIVVDVLGGGSV